MEVGRLKWTTRQLIFFLSNNICIFVTGSTGMEEVIRSFGQVKVLILQYRQKSS